MNGALKYRIIVLAEAMNIYPVRTEDGKPFDPFTDANDDYAVLEWMRNHRGKYCGVIYNVMDGKSVDYKIGDYARAALEVIE